tara:strand:- start:211 stop:360 length:150 start_codon:yes stop_codon:yes gene_type:complete
MPISRAQTAKQVKNAPKSKRKKMSAGGKIPKAKCRNGIAMRGKTRGVVV